MKFDFAIGNPPYQETQEATSDNPVYNYFMDAAYEVADKVVLITPARFLFDAGKTPKSWNRKMLQDSHFKVESYEPDSSKVFPNLATPIKGGVVISYRNKLKTYGAIDTFTKYPILNNILNKVKSISSSFIADIVYSPESYKFTEKLHADYPQVESLLSVGHKNDITSNIFDKLLDNIFFKEKPSNKKEYILITGRYKNERRSFWIQKDYVIQHPNLDKYKIFYPKANGTGQFGEVTSPAIIACPCYGHTQTFISIGAFDSKNEVEYLNKYLRTKFARCLLGILKVTQDNKKAVWRHVPQQDFTIKSDINWTKPVKEIDQQLYKKYNLTEQEIEFIESNVKEMM